MKCYRLEYYSKIFFENKNGKLEKGIRGKSSA